MMYTPFFALVSGRKIVVKEDFDVERDKYGRIVTDKDRERMAGGGHRDRSISPRRGHGGGGGGGGGGHHGGMVNYGNTYGLSTRFLESLGIDCELHTRVFVANLDYAVSCFSPLIFNSFFIYIIIFAEMAKPRRSGWSSLLRRTFLGPTSFCFPFLVILMNFPFLQFDLTILVLMVIRFGRSLRLYVAC
jgi:hypothetical protein